MQLGHPPEPLELHDRRRLDRRFGAPTTRHPRGHPPSDVPVHGPFRVRNTGQLGEERQAFKGAPPAVWAGLAHPATLRSPGTGPSPVQRRPRRRGHPRARQDGRVVLAPGC